MRELTKREKKLLVGLFISIIILMVSIIYRLFFAEYDTTPDMEDVPEEEQIPRGGPQI